MRGAPQVAAWALVPIVLIALSGRLYGDALPVEPSNVAALRAAAMAFVDRSFRADSWIPMHQALEVLHGPARDRLYATLFFDRHVRFQYPPSSLLPLELLSRAGLGGPGALSALNAVVFLLNAGACALLARRLSPPGQRAGMTLLAGLAAMLFYPLIRAQVLGQIQLWIDLLFTSALLCWTGRRRFAAGVLVGLACTIKPQLGLLLLWGLSWREWRFAAGIAAGSVPILLLGLQRYGLAAHLGYLDVLAFLSRHGEAYFANNSVNGILNGYALPASNLVWRDGAFTPFVPAVRAGTLAASVLALALLALPPLLLRRRARLSDLGAAAICTVVGAPVAWEHHYGLLMPLFLVAFWRRGGRRPWADAALLASWILVANFIPFFAILSGTAFSVLQAHCFLGGVLLLAVLMAGAGATRKHEAPPAEARKDAYLAPHAIR